MRKLVLLGPAVLVCLGLAVPALADPSSKFYPTDDWGVYRIRAFGENGFFWAPGNTYRPAIAFESLGENGELKDVAWEVGERLKGQYSGNELATQVFRYVRDRVRYTPDIDQFGVEEFARNADELAGEIENQGSARGDCEDYAVLLAVMFRAAGFRSAVVLATEHAATLVYLPDYPNANTYWELDGEKGWVWAEATGRTNPLGWTPPEYMSADLAAYEISEGPVFAAGGAGIPAPIEMGIVVGGSSFLLMLLLLLLLPVFRRR